MLAALGVVVAIGITATMDATGLSAFSALPLLPLFGLFWYLQRFSAKEVGFAAGRPRDYGLAVLYPLLIMGSIAIVAALTGALHLAETHWNKAGLNLALVGGTTIPVALLTEEGFFRGWLWASLKRARLSEAGVLVWTSLAFALWHLSAVTLQTGFNPPPQQVPTFMLNAVVLGAIWGMLRLISGSIVLSSVSHGVWNGFAYVLFGFGTHVGALGIKQTAIYGPEIGLLGLGLNAAFAALLWFWYRARS
jgi:membrane protease YdiL (CAAX protease family)